VHGRPIVAGVPCIEQSNVKAESNEKNHKTPTPFLLDFISNSIKLLPMKTNQPETQNVILNTAPERAQWQIDCVIYDCDGVLFDSLETNYRLYNHIAVSVGRHPISEDELHFCHTHTVFESIHRLFQDNEELEKKALDYWKNDIDLNEFLVYLKMEPNLIETLTILKEKGILLAISTNRTTTMKHIMVQYGLTPYFDMVVTALDVKPKPDPESVKKILQTLNIDSEKVLYIGDSEVDQKTAGSSGVKFIAYKNSELAAEGFIDDHLDLLAYLLSD
jgi:HAD superfamily hydrolase (TIGR01549 family)